MPLFTRRRLQGMLDQLGPQVCSTKARDLVARLNSKRIAQALPAEMELGLLWGLAQLGDIAIEPEWWRDEHRPDACTQFLVPGRPVVVEIAAVSDNSLSGEAEMDRVAREISRCAHEVRRGSGDFLYFLFAEVSGHQDGQYYRRRLAPRNYVLSDGVALSVREWLEQGPAEKARLHLQEPGLDVIVEMTGWKQIRYHNFHCSMPPEAHTVDDNPLYDALKPKLDQLAAAPTGTLRYIFVADVGSTLLRRVGAVMEGGFGGSCSGSQILSHFVRQYQDRVDAVVVFAPRRDHSFPGRYSDNAVTWATTVFVRDGLEVSHDGLGRLTRLLPFPRFEGYQARSMFQQNAFSPLRRGWQLGCHISGSRKAMKMKISARAFLDLVAGRSTPAQFRRDMGERDGEVNLIEHWLKLGMTLASVEVERAGVDEDDDYLVLLFSDDPAVRKLRMPEVTKDSATTGTDTVADTEARN